MTKPHVVELVVLGYLTKGILLRLAKDSKLLLELFNLAV